MKASWIIQVGPESVVITSVLIRNTKKECWSLAQWSQGAGVETTVRKEEKAATESGRAGRQAALSQGTHGATST